MERPMTTALPICSSSNNALRSSKWANVVFSLRERPWFLAS
jgi:hypothetical protein